jgi:hypothetical protein
MEESIITPKIGVNFCIYFNSVLAIADRIMQIVFYTSTTFINDDIKSNALCFLLLKPISLILMYTLYILTLDDSLLQYYDRLKLYVCFMFSQETCYSLGAHYSLKSKYSREGDNPVFTIRVLNGFHIMFTSIPQLIIVLIHMAATDYTGSVETLSVMFSSLFISWNIVYIIICGCYREQLEEQIDDMIYN